MVGENRFEWAAVSIRVGRDQGCCESAQAWRILRACLYGFQRPATPPVADLEHSETEERWFSIGLANTGAMLSIVYLWSESDPAATKVRLISAREATRTEIRHYKENL